MKDSLERIISNVAVNIVSLSNGLSPDQIVAGGGGVSQTLIPITPGHYVGVMHYFMSGETGGAIQMNLTFRDENNNQIGKAHSHKIIPEQSNGEWKTLSYEFEVLPEYNGKTEFTAHLLIFMENIKTGEIIYFDDVELLKIE